jgi:glycosyltransferase involved in cell wall biosynthesis
MAAYQAEATVGAAVESVLWQSYRDRELIVVDDGSIDRTPDIVSAHRSVRLIRQDNAGVATARNRGIGEADSELITFLDADDLLFERHLEALVDVYEREGDIVTPNSYWLLPGGIHPIRRRYRGRFPRPHEQRRAILEHNFMSIQSLFSRHVIEKIGSFSEDLIRASDWDFWIRAILGGFRARLQPLPLSLYRWGGTGLSAEWEAMDRAVDAVLRRVLEREDLRDEERASIERRLAGPSPRELVRRGDEALRQGRYRDAERCYRLAMPHYTSERAFILKARLLRPAPWLVGPIIRSWQTRVERRLRISREHTR